jgi:hypothetical protein
MVLELSPIADRAWCHLHLPEMLSEGVEAMNAPSNPASFITERQAIEHAQIKRMAARMAFWAERPDSDNRKLAALDALKLCIDSDLSDDIEPLLHEMGIDAEGYSLDDDGDRVPDADRVFVPMGRVA